MNFRQLDLNLLRVLGAVYRSGSVTKAGLELSLSQSATSNALARLRQALGDELFVASSAGLHPTPRARRIAPLVIAHLREIESVLSNAAPFDPATAREHWRLSLSDLGEMMFLPQLAQWLRRESPASSLSNVSVNAGQVGAALEAMQLDLAIGILRPDHRGSASELLYREHFVAITGEHWRPAIGRVGKMLSPRQLAGAALAVAAPAATFHDSIEQMLSRLAISDRAVLRVRHYGAMPELVTATDLMAIVPLSYAQTLAPRYAVRTWELPGHGPGYDVQMLWHECTTESPAHAWLRAGVRQLFSRR